jgi:hypothetical protein
LERDKNDVATAQALCSHCVRSPCSAGHEIVSGHSCVLSQMMVFVVAAPTTTSRRQIQHQNSTCHARIFSNHEQTRPQPRSRWDPD